MLYNDDGSKTTAQEDIATKATMYYGELSAPHQNDENEDTGYMMVLSDLLANQYDLWEWNMGVTGEDIKTALERCPRSKTMGRDDITTEQWQMAVETNDDVAAAMAWATNCRFAHMTPATRQATAIIARTTTFSARSDVQPKEAHAVNASAEPPAHAVSASAHNHASDAHARAATHTAESDALGVSLLPELANPHLVQALRPITIVPAHLKVQSKVVFGQLQGHGGAHTADGIPDPAIMGFRRGSQCAEVVSLLRGVVEKSTVWSQPVCVAQLDFARAYDSVKHLAVARSMSKRGIPAPIAAAYLR